MVNSFQSQYAAAPETFSSISGGRKMTGLIAVQLHPDMPVSDDAALSVSV